MGTINVRNKLKSLAFLVLLGPACTPAEARYSDDVDAGALPDAWQADAAPEVQEPEQLEPAEWLPVAPTAPTFAWQGSQDRIVNPDTFEVCEDANIVIALWERAVCYGARDGELMCAGQIGDTFFGPNFVMAGVRDVVQLVESGTFGSPNDSGACALKSDGSAWCLGYGQNNEIFNTASGEAPGGTWTQWGTRSDIVGLAMNNMMSMCALHEDQTVSCAGVQQEGTTGVDDVENASSLWIDPMGQPFINDETVYRTSRVFAGCAITAEGLMCLEPIELTMSLDASGAPSGEHGIRVIAQTTEAGRLVEGGPSGVSSACWLHDSGRVSCLESPGDPSLSPVQKNYFSPHPALALGVNLYSPGKSMCAVIHDGSVWCIGSNHGGKFGTGDSAPLLEATQVQPPGSANINCVR